MPARPRRPRAAPVADAEPQQIVLPNVEADSYPYLGPTTIETDFQGQTWIIRPTTAADWLKILWSEPFDVDMIFPGLVQSGRSELEDLLYNALLDEEVEPQEIVDIALEIIETAAGYKWWFVLRLTSAVKGAWSRIGGILVLRGVDANAITLGSWCSAVLALCVEMMEPKKAVAFIEDLSAVPDGVEHDPLDDMVMEEAAFLSAMSAPF